MSVAPRSATDESGPVDGIAVRAPGRLHLGFMDPAATLGRRFGSLGLVVGGFETNVQLGFSAVDRATATGPAAAADLARAKAHVEALRARTGRREALHLHLAQVLPAHAGFGSGTQLALAVGRAFATLHRLDMPTPTLAAWLGRGARSGVGIAGFDRGGLLLDGGPGPFGQPAPLLARIELPGDWRIIVIIDTRRQGLSGEAERQALAQLPPLPRAAAAEVCHRVLMQVLPGAADGDFEAFADGLSAVQRVLGDHFAPAQDGRHYASPAVARTVRRLAEAACGRLATGQSSWGPTGFAMLPSAAQAEALVLAAGRAAAGGASDGAAQADPATRAAVAQPDDGGVDAALEPGIRLHVVEGRNEGARVGRTGSGGP